VRTYIKELNSGEQHGLFIGVSHRKLGEKTVKKSIQLEARSVLKQIFPRGKNKRQKPPFSWGAH